MKGLMLKELYCLQEYNRSLLLIVVVFVVMTLLTGSTGTISAVIPLFCATLLSSTITIDEGEKWPAYAQCLPIARKKVIMAKYLMSLLLILAGIALLLAVSVLAKVRTGIAWQSLLKTDGEMLCVALVIAAITLPLTLWLGAEKARIYNMVLYMVAVTPFLIGNPDAGVLAKIMQIVTTALPFLAIVLFTASYFVSLRIYRAKEF